ncbi:MAG: hypothetical protein IPN70_00320 [Candidatus Moraniibacteriota bacterium]|nr:MAG: hypothetical protein IPN70_00320 [Candidatus Moranbacteria bacterium]
MEKITCHDCEEIISEGEKYMEYEAQKCSYYKCVQCFKKDSMLRNYRTTEVYSRVVGYIRPVSQWNKGKQAEYNDRKEYACSC